MPHPALDYLTVRLDVLTNLAKDTASEVYERDHGVSLRELRVLCLAYHTPGITQGEVVLHSMLEKTQVSRMITSLVQRGVLQRQIGAKDARLVHLHLTPAGREAVRQCNRIGRRMEKSLMASLDPAEAQVFERCLVRLTERAMRDAERLRAAT